MLFNKKRGQITVFIVIGLVLFASFLAVQYMNQQSQKSLIQSQAQRIVADLQQTTALNYYINLCLKKVSERGLTLAAQQGGNIYTFQGGIIPLSPKNLPLEKYSVSYAIVKQQTTLFFPGPPDYPFKNASILSRRGSPYYGELQLPALCDPNGVNKPGISPVLCTRYGRNSIQEQLTKYIEQNLDGCVNFSVIKSIQNITAGNPNITVLVGESNIKIDAIYPIRINLGAFTPEVMLSGFSADLDVRLKRIYDIAYNSLKLDTLDIAFNMLKDYSRFKSWDSSINLTKQRPFYPRVFDSIVTLTDASSLIDGKPFEFRFSIENRIPALEYINPSLNPEYNIMALENETLRLDPFGYDPDEDRLIYIYKGWKEDYDEYFDEQCCRQMPNRCYQNMTEIRQCTARVDPAPQSAQPAASAAPKNWSLSALYKETKRSASYKTERKDIGIHNVTIYLYDDSGLRDWQDITILIMDIAKANASLSSALPGLPPGIASVEDPYVLNGSDSVAYFAQTLKYRWVDEQENESFETPLRALTIPQNYNITNIIEGMFRKSRLTGNPTEHNITLFVEPGSSNSTITIKVYQCLPYDNPGSPAWPYNTTNPFYSSHSCCNSSDDLTEPGYGTYLSSDATCFEKTEFGGLLSFNPESIAGYNIEKAQEIIYLDESGVKMNALVYTDLNDIYKRTYQRKCSGDRGNTCAGNSVEIRQKVMVEGVKFNCADIAQSGTEDENCAYQASTIPNISSGNDFPGKCKGSTTDFSSGDTFESKYQSRLFNLIHGNEDLGITLLLGSVEQRILSADNICNNAARRADEFLQFSSAGPFVCLSKCNLQGRCNQAFRCICASGVGSTGSEECNSIAYETLYSKGYEFIDAGGQKGVCNRKCEFSDVDTSEQACGHFFGSGKYDAGFGWNAHSQVVNGNTIYDFPGIYSRNCCGDDSKEILEQARGNISWVGKTACCYDSGEGHCVDELGNCITSNTGASSCFKGKLCIDSAWKIDADSDKDGYDNVCDRFSTNPCSALVTKDLCNEQECIDSSSYSSTCV